jgi:hypothetical protein
VPAPTKLKTPFAELAHTVRRKFRLNSAHPDLHKILYVLCFPSAIVGLHAGIFFLVHGLVVWPTPIDTSAAWAADTYAAPWISFAANLTATILFLLFSTRRRVRRSSKVAASLVLTAAWLCTAISFLVID